MADNVTITGTTIAADDISGVQYQRTKIVWGSDGTATDVSASNPLPVTGSLTVDSEFPGASALADGGANPTTTRVGSHLLGYNGTTWDRLRSSTANGLEVDVTRIQGSVSVNSELPAAATIADGEANPTAPAVASFPSVWNGSTWDRASGVSASVNTITTGGIHASPVFKGASSFGVARSASQIADADAGTYYGASAPVAYNGSTFDLQRNNASATVLASLQRASTTNSAVQTNYNGKGIILFIDVSAIAASENLTPSLFFRDPVSGNDHLVWTAENVISTTGTKAYMFYPVSETTSATHTELVNTAIARSWWVRITHSSSGNWTYSVSAVYING